MPPQFSPFAPEGRAVIVIESVKDAPLSITVPRGAIVQLEGPVVGGTERRFFVLAGGKARAEVVSRDRWRLAFSTRDIDAAESDLSLHYAEGRGTAREFCRFRLKVLQKNPFRMDTTFSSADGKLTCDVRGVPPGLAVKYRFSRDGKEVRGWDTAAAHPLTGLDATPGKHAVSGEVELPYGLRVPVPAAEVEIPALATLSRMGDGALAVTEATAGDSLSGRAAFVEGAQGTPIALYVDGRRGGTIRPDGTWTVPHADLVEGPREIVATFRMSSGAEFASAPLPVSVTYDESYLALRARQDLARNVREDVPVLLKALRLTWGVRLPAEEDAVFVYRDKTIAKKTTVGSAPEPMFVMENWALFNRIVAERPIARVPSLEKRLSLARLQRIAAVGEPYGAVVDAIRIMTEAFEDGGRPRALGDNFVPTVEICVRRAGALRESPARLKAAAKAEMDLKAAWKGFVDGPVPEFDGQFARVIKRSGLVMGKRAAFYEWQLGVANALAPFGKHAPEAFPLRTSGDFHKMVWMTPEPAASDAARNVGLLTGLAGKGAQGEMATELPQAKIHLAASFSPVSALKASQAKIEALVEKMGARASRVLWLERAALEEKEPAKTAEYLKELSSLDEKAYPDIKKLRALIGEHRAMANGAWASFLRATKHFAIARDDTFPKDGLQDIKG